MTEKSPLDTHIARKYEDVSTIGNGRRCSNEPDKIWGALGAMASMNMVSQHISVLRELR